MMGCSAASNIGALFVSLIWVPPMLDGTFLGLIPKVWDDFDKVCLRKYLQKFKQSLKFLRLRRQFLLVPQAA
jgi:hypothetical protein